MYLPAVSQRPTVTGLWSIITFVEYSADKLANETIQIPKITIQHCWQVVTPCHLEISIHKAQRILNNYRENYCSRKWGRNRSEADSISIVQAKSVYDLLYQPLRPQLWQLWLIACWCKSIWKAEHVAENNCSANGKSNHVRVSYMQNRKKQHETHYFHNLIN